jgi:hypothetical protein
MKRPGEGPMRSYALLAVIALLVLIAVAILWTFTYCGSC